MRHHLAVGQVPRHAPFGARRQQVANADVGERAAGHHAVVAAASAVAVEVARLARRAPSGTCPAGLVLAMLTRPARCGRSSPSRPAQPARGHRESAGSAPARGCRSTQERRLLNVGALRRPTRTDRLSLISMLVPRLVGRRTRWRSAGGTSPAAPSARTAGCDLLLASARCPSRYTGSPSLPVPERLVDQVDVGRAGQGIGHDQRRAGQVVGLHQRIDAALEVAVAAEHGRGHQVALRHRRGHRIGQRAAVADAGRAAVADG